MRWHSLGKLDRMHMPAFQCSCKKLLTWKMMFNDNSLVKLRPDYFLVPFYRIAEPISFQEYLNHIERLKERKLTT